MKYFAIILALSAPLFAADTSWNNDPANTRWDDPANWSGGVPTATDNAILGASMRPEISLEGVNANIGNIIVNAGNYTLHTDASSQLRFDGTEIINNVGERSAVLFDISKGVNLDFSGNATSGAVSIIEDSFKTNIGNSRITYSGNATAGKVGERYEHSSIIAIQRTSALQFSDYSNSAAASVNLVGGQMIYSGHAMAGDDTVITDAGNHSTSITLYGSGSHLYFTENSSTAAAVINMRHGDVRVSFNGHVTIGSSNAATSITNTDSAYSYVDITDNVHIANATMNGTGVGVELTINGSNVTSSNFTGTLSGAGSSFYIGGNFTAGGSRFYAQNNSANGTIFITGNTVFQPTGNNQTQVTTYGVNATTIIDGNARFLGSGYIYSGVTSATAAPSTVYVQGDTVIDTSNLSVASQMFTVGIPANRRGALFIGGNTTIDGKVQISNLGNADSLLFISLPETSTINTTRLVIAGGNDTAFIIGGNTVLSTTNNTVSNGTRSLLAFVENASYTTSGAGHFHNNGTDSVIWFETNGTLANDGTTNAVFNNNGGNAIAYFGGNTIISGRRELRNQGANATMIFDGNVDLVSSAGYTPTITSNNSTSTLILAGNANINNATVTLNSGTLLQIAMAPGVSAQIDKLNINNADGARVEFIGYSEQELVIGGNGSSLGNISFTENLAIGSVRKIGGGDLNLEKQNTISGYMTVNGGNLVVNHEQALDTATLVINSGGNLLLGTAITGNNLTLGGLGGSGAFDTSQGNVTNYEIAHTAYGVYGSSFNGILSGSGDISVTNNGAFVLASGVDVSTYSGKIGAASGGIFGVRDVDLLQLANPVTVSSDGALFIGSGYSKMDTLSMEAGALIGIEAGYLFGFIRPQDGHLFVETLSNPDPTSYQYALVPPYGSPLKVGDEVLGFLSTNTTLTVMGEIGEYKMTNSLSFSVNATENATVAGASDLNLVVLQNSLVGYAKNSNEAAIAKALDAVGSNDPGNELFQWVDHPEATPDPSAVFELINPAGLSSMGRLVHKQTDSEIEVIAGRLDMQRLRGMRGGPLSDAILRVSSNVQNFQIPATSLLASTTTTIPEGATQGEASSWAGYLAATGASGDMDGDANGAGYDYKLGGISIGLDKPIGVNEGIAGFQFSYHHGKADLDAPTVGSTKVDSMRLAGYAGWLGRTGVWLQLHSALSYHDYKTERLTYDGGGLGMSKGDTTGYGASFSGELGRGFAFGEKSHWSHGPFVRLTYDWLRIDDFEESGTISSLHLSKQTPDSLRSILGWRLWYERSAREGNTYLFNARVGWAHEYQNSNQSVRARFASSGVGVFEVRGADTGKESLMLNVGGQVLFRNGHSISLQYHGDLNNDQSAHSLNAAFGVRF